MKVTAIAALSVLIALPAEAGQRHRQSNVSPSCDNDGRCTTLNVTAPTSSHIPTSERKPRHVVDGNGNGNSMMVRVQTAYGFNITVNPAYASKFQKFYALLKEHGYKVDASINKCFARVTSLVPTITSAPLATISTVGIERPPICTTLAI
jgi:hypothetical protein